MSEKTHNAMKLVRASNNVGPFGSVPRPALRVGQPYCNGVILVESNKIVPWLKFRGPPCCVLNSTICTVKIAMSQDFGGNVAT